MGFKESLKLAGINQSELGRRIGITKQSISRWDGNAPEYAMAYIDLLIEYNRVVAEHKRIIRILADSSL